MNSNTLRLLSLLPAALLTDLGQTQGVCPTRTPVLLSGSVHYGKISPSGDYAAYLKNVGNGQSQLFVRKADASQTEQATGPATSNWPSFTWKWNGSGSGGLLRTTSSLAGPEIRYYPAVGGNLFADTNFPATVSELTLQSMPVHQVFCGTFRENNQYKLFWRDSANSNTPTVTLTSATRLLPLDVDPTGTYLLFLRFTNTGRELLRQHRNGSQPVVLVAQATGFVPLVSGGAFGDDALNGYTNYRLLQQQPSDSLVTWNVPGGLTTLTNNAFESFESATPNASHLLQAGFAQTWLVASGNHLIQSAAKGRLALIPTQGGGEVIMETESNGSSPVNPTIDAAATRVAYTIQGSGKMDFYTLAVDRPIRILPKARVNMPFTVRQPVAAGEFGSMFLSPGMVSGAGQTVSGFCGTLDLTPPISTVYSGVPGGAGTIDTVFQVPNMASLVNTEIVFQGARLSGSTGDFSRPVRVRIHQ